MAQTYLEQYCTDTTLDIAQRTEILRHATEHSNQVDEVSTKMHLTQAQLFYFNVDKQQAYHHLELYLDARLAACKLTCYTCKQRVRPGSVPFTCASCGVASYCGRRHQKMTWKNERICHRVLCPLLGYWRVSKKKRKKRHGFTNEDRHRREYERVFDTFFESICPHMKLPANNPSYTMKNWFWRLNLSCPTRANSIVYKSRSFQQYLEESKQFAILRTKLFLISIIDSYSAFL